MALIVQALESRKAQAETWAKEAIKTVEIDPVGPADRPHTIYYKPIPLSFGYSNCCQRRWSGGSVVYHSTKPCHVSKPESAANTSRFTPRNCRRRCIPANCCNWPRASPTTCRSLPEWADIVNAAGDGLRTSSACRRSSGARPALPLAALGGRRAGHRFDQAARVFYARGGRVLRRDDQARQERASCISTAALEASPRPA